MMKKLFLPVLILFALQGAAQNVFTLKEGEISFFSEAPMENIDAHNTSANSILNSKTQEMAFLVPIRKFVFKKALMQEHFNEKYMESDKYPTASFKGKFKEDVDFSKDGETNVSATGKLTIHGVEKDVTFPGKVIIRNGEISIQSDFKVLVKDYNITIPKLMFQNIAESIEVKVRVKYIPYKK
jgi:hypothetical protein